MPYRTGRHNRRQLIYRLSTDLPADTPADDERWTLALVITDPAIDPRWIVDTLNRREVAQIVTARVKPR
jgi:hypothetical protein